MPSPSPTLIIQSAFPLNASTPGHVWLTIVGVNGTINTYGFYPKTSGLSGPGEVKQDYDRVQHPVADVSSIPIPISEAQAQAIRDFAAKPATYNWRDGATGLPGAEDGEYNCSTWAINAARKAGVPIDTPFPVPLWIPWWLPKFANPKNRDSPWDQGDPATGLPWPGADPESNDKYRAGLAPPAPRDPLAIDLAGNGIETVGITTTPILFDHNADGIRTGTGWIKATDAWLVLDRDGNGTIDSGRELFGVDTVLSGRPGIDAVYAATGFQALDALNSNGDTVFSAADAAFSQVRLWQDLNQDGVSQANELFTLADKGIASIGLVTTAQAFSQESGWTVATADAANDEKLGAIFPAKLTLGDSVLNVDGKRIKLSPGMNLIAEIKTGQRRVIDYLMSPVQQAAGKLLKER